MRPEGFRCIAGAPELDKAALIKDLLVRVGRDADREAFRALHNLTAPHVYAVCLRMMRAQHQAEEAMQEAFLLIWRKASQYDPNLGPALPWMLMVSRNRAVSMLRTLPPPAVDIDEHIDLPDDVTPAIDQVVGDIEISRAVRTALSLLPEKPRHALELAFFEGLEHPAVAARMGVPLGTAKSWIRRALISLRQQLPAEYQP